MTPQEIKENNILLAEFMGAYEGNAIEKGDIVMCGVPAWYSKKGHTNTHLAKDLKFHNDWNWLMQIVDRIEAIIVDDNNSFNVTIGATNYCVIQDSNGELYEGVEDYGDSKLMTTYTACIAFVKWYNQQGYIDELRGGN